MNDLAEYFRDCAEVCRAQRRCIVAIPGDELDKIQLLEIKALFVRFIKSCEWMMLMQFEDNPPNSLPDDAPKYPFLPSDN